MNKSSTVTMFRVKQHNDFTEPYMYRNAPDSICISRNTTEYVVEGNETLFRQIVEDLLDAPKQPLTAEDVRKDFDSDRRKLPDSKIKAIIDYYNGRLAILKKVVAHLDAIDFKKDLVEDPIVMKFNVPFEQNYFSCEDDYADKAIKQNDAYIEIEIWQKHQNGLH